MEAPIRILVVDDDPAVLRGTCRVLEQVGYSLSTAASGAQALALTAEQHPDLLLLAWNMPDMSGIEVCRRIKADPSLNDVFVVFASGSHLSGDDQVIGLQTGADGYILRPISNDELRARVNSYVRILRLVRTQREQAAALKLANEEMNRVNALQKKHASELEAANKLLLDSSTASLNLIEDAVLAHGRLEASNKELLVEVADRKKAEDALRINEQRFRLLIEKSLAGMYVSRNGCYVYANPRLEGILGYGPGELVGVSANDVVLPDDLSIMNAAREKLKTGEHTAAYEARARRKDGSIVELGVQSVVVDFEGARSTIGMAQDIGERHRAEAEIKSYIARLEQTTEATLQAVALMVEQRDPYTAGHERRVGDLAAAIGAEMGLQENTVKGLRLTGYVHDLGKISVPAELLSKPSKLSSLEFQLIKTHAEAGYNILKDVDFPWPVAEVILQHHERPDGSGYPRQLKGAQILLEARIMAVADVIEAMSSHRPYRPGLGLDKALDEIEKNSGTLYDPQVAAACLRLFREKGHTLPT